MDSQVFLIKLMNRNKGSLTQSVSDKHNKGYDRIEKKIKILKEYEGRVTPYLVDRRLSKLVFFK